MSEKMLEQIAELVQATGSTVACAESLTGGGLCAALAKAPDSSQWFRGGVVAYASETKFRVLQVPRGPVVTEDCAVAMAEGVAHLLDAEISVAVTGVGGPGPEEGRPAGTVHLAVRHRGHVTHEELHFTGDAAEIVEQTVEVALDRLLRQLRQATVS